MTWRIINGDALTELRKLPDESVHCCVTSPPYWGLRDYGVAGQYGLEPTIGEYVEKMVAVFAEVRRVLRSDGTLWLNVGDSYAGGGRGGNPADSPHRKQATNVGSLVAPTPIPDGLKAKDLCGIPWRLAFALQADGWWLRQDIIWSKPNPMPESVTDRCTKAHEYIFLLSRSERYYYDANAITEPLADSSVARLAQNVSAQEGSERIPGKTNGNMKAVMRSTNIKGDMSERGVTRTTEGLSLKTADEKIRTDGRRNKRSVWTVTTQPFKGAHFATFPPALIEPCILAGSPTDGTVLDPFGGAGTTALVCDRLGRSSVIIELNNEYADMAERRVRMDHDERSAASDAASRQQRMFA